MNYSIRDELKDMEPNDAAQMVVEAWFEGHNDVMGSYIGMSTGCEPPEQDADDL